MPVKPIKVSSGTPVVGEDGKKSRPGVSFQFDLPNDLADAINRYGDENVFKTFLGQLVVRVQARARVLLEEGKSAEEITALLADWKPGDKVARAATPPPDPVAYLLQNLDKLSPEKLAELNAFFAERTGNSRRQRASA
jgi:hypothetical protein